MLSHFDRIPERDERTDRQTDRIAISISRVTVLTRDKHCREYWCRVLHYHRLEADIIKSVPEAPIRYAAKSGLEKT